jgi:hypothetical protein
MQNIQRLNHLTTVHVPYCQLRSPGVFVAQLQHWTINTNGNLVQYYRLYQDLQHRNDYNSYSYKYAFKHDDDLVHLVHLTTLKVDWIYFFHCGSW